MDAKLLKNKIFLIEDEPNVIDIYKTALESAGMEVDGITSGKEAMEKIQDVQKGKRTKPDLVLLDLVLPDINGLEILYAIRKNEKTKDIAVFILSNYSSDALRNMKYIKSEKLLVKTNTPPLRLTELVKEQLKQ